jgi:hypothetical protein
MPRRSQVKYKKNGKYLLQEAVSLSGQQERLAQEQGQKDAKVNPYDVMQTKATDYERKLQHEWGKKINTRTAVNIRRVRGWIDLLRREMQVFLLAKSEFAERLRQRPYKLSDSRLGKLSYTIILSLITIVEIPVNVTVFDIFGESVIFTFVLASILSVILALLTHYVGGWLKEGGAKVRSTILIVTVFLLLGIIAWVRFKFLVTQEYSVVKDIFKTNLELVALVWLFFIVNSLLFVVGLVTSYMHHDSNPLFVKARKRYNRHYMKLSNLFSAFEQEMLNLRQSITNCQECFEEQRRIYADAYRSEGAALPQCLKEAITVEIAKIGEGELVERLQEIDEDFNEQKSAVKDALKPVIPD